MTSRAKDPIPRLSVVIPALGEAATVCRAVSSVALAAACADMVAEVVVADAEPGDGGSPLSALDRLDPAARSRLAGVRGLRAPQGRARQMNAGAAAARGEILLFLHADTRLPETALATAARLLDNGARAGAFGLEIDSPRASIRFIARMATLRARFLGLPFGDQGLFLRRDLFENLGGFADLPLMEDVEFVRRLARNGARPVVARENVVTSARRFERLGPLACTLRNWTLLSLYLLGAPPARLARFYRPMGGA